MNPSEPTSDAAEASVAPWRGLVVRLLIMAIIATLLWRFAAWDWAGLWWGLYASLQGALLLFQARVRDPDPRVVCGLSFAIYAVSGAAAWQMWEHGGELGLVASTMFLCGLLVQQVVASMGRRALFWSCAAPLIGYLILVPPIAFGARHLLDGLVAAVCGLMFVAYLSANWMAQQRTLEAMAESRRKAEAANLAKTDFLATMSHEIRTPMNAVLGAAHLLQRAELQGELREHVEMLAGAGQSLMQILNDVLDLSRIEAGKLTLEPAAVDLNAFVQRCVAVWAPRARDKGLRFSVGVAPDAPEHVELDATRVGQIIFNLLSNAVKFTEGGEIRLTLTSQAVEPGRVRLCFGVADSGIGMPPEALARLFSAFEQADNSISRRFGGTGLGLAISRKIAHMMDGEIEVTSREGEGSTFSFSVLCPIAEVAAAADVGEAERPSAQLDRPARLLLAEDNPANQRIVELFLRPIGVDLTIVSDGAQALLAASQCAFDVILMDVQMPVMDGLEATRQIRAGGGPNANAPIIALTANVMERDRRAAHAAGVSGFVAKPIDPRVLLSAIFSAVEGSSDSQRRDPAATAA